MAIPNATVYNQTSFNTWFESYGQVYLVKKISSSRVIVGGSFGWTNGDTNVNNFACVNANTGEIDYTYNSGGTGFNGTVWDAFTDAWDSTKVIIVGSFTEYNGQPACGMIRLNSDGSKDSTFINTGTTTGGIYRVKYFSTDLYMVGSFTQINGVACNKVAKLDRYGTVNTTFATNVGSGANGDIYAIGWLDSGNDVILGGDFSDFNGTAVGNICRVNNSGILQATNSHFNGFIFDLQYPMDGSTLWALGGFTSWTGSTGVVAQGGITQINAGFTDLRLKSTFTGNTGFNGMSIGRITPFITNYGYVVTTNGNKYNGNDCGQIVAINLAGTEQATKFGDTRGGIYGLDVSGYDVYAGRISEFNNYSFPTPYSLRVLKMSNTSDYDTITGNTHTIDCSGIGTNDGQIIVSGITGGAVTGEYQVAIYGSGGTWTYTSGNDSIQFLSLSAGTYNVYVRDYINQWNVTYLGEFEIHEAVFTLQSPINLNKSGDNFFSIALTWDDNNAVIAQLKYHLQQLVGSTWVTKGIVNGGVETYTYTGLTPQTQYSLRVAAVYTGITIETKYSATYVTQTKTFPQDFCASQNYSITGSTCGSQDGKIGLSNPDYQLFYDFSLTDSFGNNYSFTAQTISVSSGYYFLTAIPKPAYVYQYQNSCGFSWLEVLDSDSTMTLTPVIRGSTSSYLITTGTGDARIYFDWTDSVSGLTHNYYLWKANGENIMSVTGSTGTTDFYKTPLNNGDYYAIIENESGCKTLSGLIHVTFIQSPFNLSGVKHIYLSEYKDNLDLIYWKTSDEDYYVEALDLLKFQSAKIKSIENANTWYSIPADIDTVFTQSMEKVRQGFVFANKLTLSISPSQYNKWVATGTLLDKRWVVVFEDNNGNYWIFGERNAGAQIRAYIRKSDYNYYEMEITSNSGDKILTAIDYENYVLPYIINS